MKLNALLGAAALAASAMLGNTATAATYGTIGGPGGNNEYLPSSALGGYFGGNLYLTGGSADIKVTIVGGEAGFLNRFGFGDTVWSFGNTGSSGVFDNNGVATGGSANALTFTSVAAGLLNFWFGADVASPSVTNGSNPDNSTLAPNFFVSFLPNPAATFGQSVMLFFDDGGSTDDNHDDMIVRLDLVGGGSIAPVPLPAGGLLLIGALGGLAALRRRRQAA